MADSFAYRVPAVEMDAAFVELRRVIGEAEVRAFSAATFASPSGVCGENRLGIGRSVAGHETLTLDQRQIWS